METAIKRKVNRVGLIMQIVSIVVIVAMSIACAALLTGAILVGTLPQDAVNVGIKTDMDVSVDDRLIGSLADNIPDEMPPAVAQTIAGFLETNGTFGSLTVDRTENVLSLRASTERMEFRMGQMESGLIAQLAICAIILTLFIFVKLLADALRRCDTPFIDPVIHRMTMLAYAFLCGCVAMAFIERGGIAFFLIALLMFALTMIFRYGVQLQRQADETL